MARAVAVAVGLLLVMSVSGDGMRALRGGGPKTGAANTGRRRPLTIDDRLIGWKGETYNPKDVWENRRLEGPGPKPTLRGLPPDESLPKEVNHPQIDTLSWEPRAWLYHNFVTEEEADHIRNTADPKMKRSTVVDAVSGGSIVDNIRTSSGTFLLRQGTETLAKVEEKVAKFTMLPLENQEDTQVLHYDVGQKYDAHWDYFDDPVKHRAYLNGGQRIATVVIYLNTPEEGGETVFPHSKWIDKESQAEGKYSQCGARGVAAKPKKGDAVLFWSMKTDGTEDRHSLHAGCPPVKGEKWIAVKWIHAGPFQVANRLPSANGKCMDLNENCAGWAGSGECEKNKAFMLGDGESEGQCRLSCKACTPKSPAATL